MRYLTRNVDGKSLILKIYCCSYQQCSQLLWIHLITLAQKNQVDRLDVCQKKAIRKITGQAKTAPSDSLFQELQVPTMKSVIDINFLKSRERALRLPVEHPRRTCLDREPLTRIRSRYNCRSRRINLSQTWPDEA